MKKRTVIGSALATALVASCMSMTAFAASNPADDASNYSYNSGKQAYASRMAETPAWYDNEDESTTTDYSYNAGSQAAQSRNDSFAGMPTGDDASEEQVESWFDENGIGEGSAWSNGQYDESSKGSYGYNKGQAAYQQRHASFSADN